MQELYKIKETSKILRIQNILSKHLSTIFEYIINTFKYIIKIFVITSVDDISPNLTGFFDSL